MTAIRNFVAMIAGIVFVVSACKKDEKPPAVPSITTTAISNITATSASSGGTITSNGGAEITASGLAWSKTSQTPTITDDTTKTNTVSGSFTSELANLDPSATYYVRAYAINSVGVGYGNAVTFSTGNAAPEAKNINITGTTEVNHELTAAYTYFDHESNPESGTSFQWYRANDGTGSGETAISGATSLSYTLADADEGKYIRIGITPRSSAGTPAGAETKSAFVGAIGEATTVTFTYNGQQVTYGIINSPITGRKWLDRNLGAPSIPGSVSDFTNYGDLFQWGRLADGHQLIIRNGLTNADNSGVTGTTSSTLPYEFSTTDDPGHNKFIIMPNGERDDWRNPGNDGLWQGNSGINNPCPNDWRIPTQAEWQNETISNINDGYSKLKLTYTFARTISGSFIQATTGNYWTSSIGTVTPGWAVRMRVNASVYEPVEQPRAQGLAVRCIKN